LRRYCAHWRASHARSGTRLLLVRRTDGRPPGWDRENDYDVVFRGRKVRCIWKYDYIGKVGGARCAVRVAAPG